MVWRKVSQKVTRKKLRLVVSSAYRYMIKHNTILGFHMTSQALLKSVSSMLVPWASKFMLITGHFYIEASLQWLKYFAKYMNIQKEENYKSTGHNHLKVSQCSLSMPKT